METECRYDIIFGRDFCTQYGVVMDFDKQEMMASNVMIPMRIIEDNNDVSLAEVLEAYNEDETLLDTFQTQTEYCIDQLNDNKISLAELAMQQQHLTKLK